MICSNIAVATRLCENAIDTLETGDMEKVRLNLEYIKEILKSPHETNLDYSWDDLN